MVLQSGTEGPVLRAFSRIYPEIVTELQDGPSLRRRGGGAGAGRMRPSAVFVDFGSGMDDPFRPSVDPVGQPKEAVRRRRIDHQPPRDEGLVAHCFTRFHPCKIRRTFIVLLSMIARAV